LAVDPTVFEPGSSYASEAWMRHSGLLHLALVIAVLAISNDRSVAQTERDTEEALLKVNGEAFTRTDLANRELWNYRQGGSKTLPETLVDQVNLMVLVQQGRKRGFAMTDALFRDLIAAQMKANHLDTEAQWRAAFAQERLGPLAEFRREKERELIVTRVVGDLLANVTVTDDEALAEKQKETLETYLARLRADATIEWPIPAMKRAYEEGLAKRHQ
jgi:hypothetical protein